jgi:hypothetical protein
VIRESGRPLLSTGEFAHQARLTANLSLVEIGSLFAELLARGEGSSRQSAVLPGGLPWRNRNRSATTG